MVKRQLARRSARQDDAKIESQQGADALKYTLNAGWTVTGNASDGFVIKTTGVYSTANASDGPTSGTMNFSIQPPTDPTTGRYNFSASGTTVPEPGSMALLGSGLLGLGMVARRRRKQ